MYFTFSAHSSNPPSIHVKIPSFKTVIMAATEVTATCEAQTAFDANLTWLIDDKPLPSDQVKQATNSTHIISSLTVSVSQWKTMKLLKCKAEHTCFSSAEKIINVTGKRTRQNINQVCFESEGSKREHLLCFLLLSSRASSYTSISGDQEISPRYTERQQNCAWMLHHTTLLQWCLRHFSGRQCWHLW